MEAYACDVIVTSAEDVAGVWKQYLGDPGFAAPMGMGYIHYQDDGSFFIADTPENTIESYNNYPFGNDHLRGRGSHDPG